MNYQDHANALRDSADALEDAQRALNHLDALLQNWNETSDSERWFQVGQARARLDGTWSGEQTRSLSQEMFGFMVKP